MSHRGLARATCLAVLCSSSFAGASAAEPHAHPTIDNAVGDQFVQACEALVERLGRVQMGHCPGPGAFKPFENVCRDLAKRLPDLGLRERAAALRTMEACLPVTLPGDRKYATDVLTKLFCEGNAEQQTQFLPCIRYLMAYGWDVAVTEKIAGSVSGVSLFKEPAEALWDVRVLEALVQVEAHADKAKRNTALVSQNIKRLEKRMGDGTFPPLVPERILNRAHSLPLQDETVLLMVQADTGRQIGGPGSISVVEQLRTIEKLSKRPPSKGVIQALLLLSYRDAELGDGAREAYVRITGAEGLEAMDAFYLDLLKQERPLIRDPHLGTPSFFWYRTSGYLRAEAQRDANALILRLKARKARFSADRLGFLKSRRVPQAVIDELTTRSQNKEGKK